VPELDPSGLGGLFERGIITRGQFLRALAALGVTIPTTEMLFGGGARPVLAAPASATYLVVIVLDAFRADYLQLQSMPALSALIASGTFYPNAWVGHLESETPTGHASLSTGSIPARTGILGFEWRDGKTKQEVMDGWSAGVLAGDMDRDLRASGTGSIPAAIKAANPAARVVTLSSEKVYAADAMGGPTADYILFHKHTGPTRTQLLPSAVPGHAPPPAFFSHPNLRAHTPMGNFQEWDWLSAMLALAAFDEFHPTALMINLPGADVYGHPYGPAVPAVMQQVIDGLDRNIARIVRAYQKAGIYDQTVFVVTADHGMVPNNRSVGEQTIKAAVKAAGGELQFMWGGTGACIWLRNWWRGRAVAEAMLRVRSVAAAYYQVDRGGRYQYLPAPGMVIDPGLDAANQYLLATFGGPKAPDVVAPFRENTIAKVYSHARGDHGGLNWGSQHIPLVIAGPGVAPGRISFYPSRLVDIAPTVLRLLGIPAPAMDGVVLADALTSPLAADTAIQQALAPQLSTYQSALITQSQDNIAEDAELGIKSKGPRTIHA